MIIVWVVATFLAVGWLTIMWRKFKERDLICGKRNGKLICTLATDHLGPCVDNRHGGANPGERENKGHR